MPFPFAAAAVGAIVSAATGAAATAATVATAVGTAATLGAVAGTAATVVGGTLLAGGAIATAAAISVYNDQKRADVAARARAEASRENERIILDKKRENDRKLKDLNDKYGDTIPKEQIDPVMQERVDILYRLDGNSQGLRDKGEIPDEEAAAAADELNAMRDGKLTK